MAKNKNREIWRYEILERQQRISGYNMYLFLHMLNGIKLYIL